MSEQTAILEQSIGRLFTDLMAHGMPDSHTEETLRKLWEKIENLGIPSFFLPEEMGGFGGDWRDAGVVFRLLGRHALPAPVGETMLARRWLRRAGVDIPDGPITLAGCARVTFATDAQTRLTFSGSVTAAPWGAQAPWLLVAWREHRSEQWALLPTALAARVDACANAADEPRATLHFDAAPVAAHWRDETANQSLCAGGALLRAAQMAGALETLLQLSIDYANERQQFGRAIGKFQAIQQQLAVLAQESAAAACAAASACLAADCGDADFEIAAAKLRANRAAAQATAIAHQVHGAIGFTREHSLHHFTLRLLAWRGEFGNDRHWALHLGRHIARQNPRGLWHLLTERGDRMRTGEQP